eukprot:TRINITY_DN11133_c0_g1_i1.p2 TRINITY_DN11133_c0_g1~~TRINITY_DN11133_c0_g1_i1.p2  ORF type:complete len:170 (+),score=72.72 TRINITY_DN11133_c0_g1_i1:75-584(+)
MGKAVYLAGPDVFEQDPLARGAALKALCAEYGFEGHFPMDNAIAEQPSPAATAEAIRVANVKLIQEADVVMANLNPFRGFEPDSGTVYEVGYAEALGKPVFSYASDRRFMLDRLHQHQALPAGAKDCKDGKQIEHFELSHNLMFAHTVVADDAKGCLAFMKEKLAGESK